MPARSDITILISSVFIALFLTGKPWASDSTDDATYKSLRLKVETLERTPTNQSIQLSDTKQRLSQLALKMKTAPIPNGSPNSSTADLAKLKNYTNTLAVRVRRLETKVDGINRSNLQRAIDRLEQRVSSLQVNVQRLKSQR